MDVLVVLVVAVLAVVGVTALAPKVGVAAPLLLVLVGLAATALPLSPVEVSPELLLEGILPPLLYSAAVTVPTTELRRDLRTISGLSVVLVVVTAVVVGLLVAAVVPGVDVATGIALGAALSPTDAVATSVVRAAGASPRIVTVLQGESLLNDATALVLLRAAIAGIAGTVALADVLNDFVLGLVVAVAVGWLVGRANLLVRARLRRATLGVAVSLVVPFVASVPVEVLGGSGLVAAVVAGLVTGNGSAKVLGAQDRLTERAVWGTVELLLESAVFLLMGLQLTALLDDLRANGDSLPDAVLVGVAALAVVLVVRGLFVAPSLWSLNRRARRGPAVREAIAQAQGRLAAPRPARPGPPGEQRERRLNRLDLMLQRRLADLDYLAAQAFGPRDSFVITWAGMRGAVTLAAAQSLPLAAPRRSLLVLAAFVAALVSLLLQGGTLPWTLRRLGLTGRDPQEARAERAALDAEVRARVEARLDDLVRADGTPFSEDMAQLARSAVVRVAEDERREERRELRLAILLLQRQELLRLRDVGAYSSEALGAALDQLDADELGLALRMQD